MAKQTIIDGPGRLEWLAKFAKQDEVDFIIHTSPQTHRVRWRKPEHAPPVTLAMLTRAEPTRENYEGVLEPYHFEGKTEDGSLVKGLYCVRTHNGWIQFSPSG